MSPVSIILTIASNYNVLLVYQQIMIAFSAKTFGNLPKNAIALNRRHLLFVKELMQNMSLWTVVLQSIMVASDLIAD